MWPTVKTFLLSNQSHIVTQTWLFFFFNYFFWFLGVTTFLKGKSPGFRSSTFYLIAITRVHVAAGACSTVLFVCFGLNQ